jgi:hypothetical protein
MNPSNDSERKNQGEKTYADDGSRREGVGYPVGNGETGLSAGKIIAHFVFL